VRTFAGVFAIFCRHGIILKALNMATGERWAYATLLLSTLLDQSVVPQTFWLVTKLTIAQRANIELIERHERFCRPCPIYTQQCKD
jgi:hypothetical protein